MLTVVLQARQTEPFPTSRGWATWRKLQLWIGVSHVSPSRERFPIRVEMEKVGWIKSTVVATLDHIFTHSMSQIRNRNCFVTSKGLFYKSRKRMVGRWGHLWCRIQTVEESSSPGDLTAPSLSSNLPVTCRCLLFQERSHMAWVKPPYGVCVCTSPSSSSSLSPPPLFAFHLSHPPHLPSLPSIFSFSAIPRSVRTLTPLILSCTYFPPYSLIIFPDRLHS